MYTEKRWSDMDFNNISHSPFICIDRYSGGKCILCEGSYYDKTCSQSCVHYIGLLNITNKFICKSSFLTSAFQNIKNLHFSCWLKYYFLLSFSDLSIQSWTRYLYTYYCCEGWTCITFLLCSIIQTLQQSSTVKAKCTVLISSAFYISSTFSYPSSVFC